MFEKCRASCGAGNHACSRLSAGGAVGRQVAGLSSLAVVVALIGSGAACAQIQQPQLGTMLTRDGMPLAVFGVTGSVTTGDAPPGVDPPSGSVPSILSMGCSRQICLMKTDSTLVSFPASIRASPTGSVSPVVDAPAGPALFWFESSQSTLVYFPRSRQLARLQNGLLSPVDFDITGEILSIGEAADGTLRFAVRNPAGTWIVRTGDVIVESLHGPDSPVPVLLLHGGVLFVTSGGLILRRPDQSELVFQLRPAEAEPDSTYGSTTAPGPRPSGEGAPPLAQIALSWLGEKYVQVRVRGSGAQYSNYALRIDLGHERLFLLPEPQP
jgi:hypothetical protein